MAADRIKSIFLEAVENYSPDQWDAFLQNACGGDAELMARVKVLLDAHLGEDSLLDLPRAENAPTLDQPVSERPDAQIGPYKLLQQIGEGGMGTVYLAEQQEPVRRVVALKIIKPGMDSRQVIARFEAERQALALMDHPNIARVYDGGSTENGRPYFVMELFKGVPITTYCDEHHLTPDQRLELFVPVCQAVQHAHQKGIIHRDLKPGNVLVSLYDGRPVPKVIDFGVAKATGPTLTERTLFTELGQVVGTLEYMSPEQAELNEHDVDTRSDIYSLGVLLYELLTGTTPFEKKRFKTSALMEMLRIIREEEPPRPSTRLGTTDQLPSIAANRGLEPKKLSGLVRGDLDWIVMKCLEKDRNRRYETANGLAMELHRYLAGEPVVACPPSAVNRFRKFARRNKGTITTAILLVTMLIAGVVVSTWQAIRATEAKKVAQTKEAEAVTQATTAREIAELLQEMLGSANPDSTKGAEYTVRQLLDDFSAGLGDQLKDQPEAEASIRATIGKAYFRLGLPDSADHHLQRALDLRRRLFGPEHAAVAEILINLSVNLYERNAWEDAEKRAREALAIHEKLNLRNRATIEILGTLQLVLQAQRKYTEANAVGQQALDIAGQQSDQYPELATVLHRMAGAAHAQGEFEKAEHLARESVALHRRLHGDDHPETGWGLLQLGRALQGQQKLEDAEQQYRDAIAIFRRYYGNHKSLDLVYADLADVLKAQDKPSEIIDRERLEQANLSTERTSRDPEAWIQRARAEANLGKWDDAISSFDKVVELGKSAVSDANARLADGCDQLARSFREHGKDDEEAERVFRYAIALREPLAADTPEGRHQRVEIGHALWQVAGIQLAKGRHREAETILRDALKLFEDLTAANPEEPYYRQETAFALRLLSDVLQAAGRSAEASEELSRAADIYKKLFADSPANLFYRSGLAHTYVILATRLKAEKQLQEAEDLYSQAVRIYESPTSSDRLWLAFTCVDQGIFYRDRLLFPEAEQALRIAWRLYTTLISESPLQPSVPWRLVSCAVELGHILRQTGRVDEAEVICRRALHDCRAAVAQNGILFADRNLRNDRSSLGGALESLGQFLGEMNKLQTALEAYGDAQALWRALIAELNVEDDHFRLAANRKAVVELLRRAGRLDEPAGEGAAPQDGNDWKRADSWIRTDQNRQRGE